MKVVQRKYYWSSEGADGVLPEEATLDLGLERQGELEHTKVEKRIFLNVLEESEGKGSADK